MKYKINLEVKENIRLYKWKKEDHICSVAEKFKTSCKKIIEANNLTNIDYIKEGQWIIIK